MSVYASLCLSFFCLSVPLSLCLSVALLLCLSVSLSLWSFASNPTPLYPPPPNWFVLDGPFITFQLT